MLRSQTLELRQSEIRSRLAELQSGEEITDEQHGQMDELTTEFRRNETELRAALIGEDADRQAHAPDDSQARERRSLIDSFEIRQAIGVLTERTAMLSGPTAELVQEMRSADKANYQGIPIPYEALLEQRTDTVSSGTPTPEMTAPIVDRIFADSVAQRMGIRQINVPFGDRVFPVAIAGAAFNWVASEGADLAAAVAYATGDVTLSPDHTGGTRIDVTRVAMKQSGPNLEAAIRRDMRASIQQGLDQATFLGSGAAGQPTGILVDGAVPATAIAATADYAAFRTAAVQFMTDNIVGGFDAIRILTRPEILNIMDDAVLTGTSETEWDRFLRRFSNPVLTSSAVAAPAGTPLAVEALMSTTYAGVPPVWTALYGGIDMISDQFHQGSERDAVVDRFADLRSGDQPSYSAAQADRPAAGLMGRVVSVMGAGIAGGPRG